MLANAVNKQPANWGTLLDGSSGWPTYYGTVTDPSFTFNCTLYGGCSQMIPGQAPSGAIVQGNGNPNAGPDKHFTLIDQNTNNEIDLYQLATSPIPNSSGAISTGFAGWEAASGDGCSQYGAANASHVGNLAGRIRVEELNAALANAVQDQRYINHALTIAVPCVSAMTVLPAAGSDGRQCNAWLNSTTANDHAPPMGAHLQLNMAFADIDSLPSVPEWKKVILRTLAKYGAYVNDTGSDFYFDWQTEAGVQYIAMNVTDLWRSFGASRAAETGSDWYVCENDLGTADTYCPETTPRGYKGLWTSPSDGSPGAPLNWDSAVWSHLRVLAPPATCHN